MSSLQSAEPSIASPASTDVTSVLAEVLIRRVVAHTLGGSLDGPVAFPTHLCLLGDAAGGDRTALRLASWVTAV